MRSWYVVSAMLAVCSAGASEVRFEETTTVLPTYAPLITELKQAIKELETPPPTVINAHAKFAGENSAMERAAKAREKADGLKALLKEIENTNEGSRK